MQKVISLLEKELEGQCILRSTEGEITNKCPEYDFTKHLFEDDLIKAIQILKRHQDHDPRTQGYDTNYVEQTY